MKPSFQTKLRIIVLLMLIILVAQSAFIIHYINKIHYANENDIHFIIKDRILTIEYIFLFIEIIIGIILLFYVPIILNKSFRPIENVFNEIEQGKLDITIPEEFKKGPVSSLIHSTNIMLNNLKTFDNAKKVKIIENRNRLDLILKNSNDGVIIINDKFEIVLINNHAQKLLGISSIEDNPPILNFHFEGELLKYFEETFSKKMLIPERKIYLPKIKKHITFRNGVTHDEEGRFSGMVIVITDIDLKKLYETTTIENVKSKQEH